MCANETIQGFALYTGTLPYFKCRYATWTTPSSSWRRWRSRWRRWRPRRQRPAGVSPSNLQLQVSVLVFLCFCGASSRERRGIILIGVFRSKRSRWRKDRRQRSFEDQKRGSHAAHVPGRVGPLQLGLDAPLTSIFPPPTPF